MLLTLALVGSFYGVFSVFIRSLFPVSACISIHDVSPVLENIYLIVLFIILLVSTTRKVEKSELYYQIAAIILGGFMAVSIAVNACSRLRCSVRSTTSS